MSKVEGEAAMFGFFQLCFLRVGDCKLEGRQQVFFDGHCAVWMWARKHPAVR